MIIRVVKMAFREDTVNLFIEIFNQTRQAIEQFEGCRSVELMKDANTKDQYFTLSRWETEEDLQNYRDSYLFKSTWAKVKPLFLHQAEAWSLKHL